MAITTIPTRTSTNPNASADINTLMDNDTDLDSRLNLIYPIGYTYIQFPGDSSP